MGKTTGIKWDAASEVQSQLTIENIGADVQIVLRDAKTKQEWVSSATNYIGALIELGVIPGSGGDSNWTLSGNDIYNSNPGNVGINNTTPTEKLDIVGGLKSLNTIGDWNYLLANTPDTIFTIAGQFLYNTNTNQALGVFLDHNSGTVIVGSQDLSASPFPEYSFHGGSNFASIGLNLNNNTFEKGVYITKDNGTTIMGTGDSSGNVLNYVDEAGGSDLGVIKGDGKFGFGTMNPTRLVDIVGDFNKTHTAGGYQYDIISNSTFNGMRILDTVDNTQYAAMILDSGAQTAGLINLLDFANGNASSAALNTTSLDLTLWINGIQNGKLLLDSTTGVQSWASTDDNLSYIHQFKNASGQILVGILGNGNTGIGIDTPAYKLHTLGSVFFNDILGDNNTSAYFAQDEIHFSASNNNLGTQIQWGITPDGVLTVTMGAGGYSLFTGGNVGIGSSGTPSSRLTVGTGDIEVIGSANGIILESPDSTRWRVTISDLGVLTTTTV